MLTTFLLLNKINVLFFLLWRWLFFISSLCHIFCSFTATGLRSNRQAGIFHAYGYGDACGYIM